MTTKIEGEPLWTTDTKPTSGSKKLLYGIEVEDEIKELYNVINLNE